MHSLLIISSNPKTGLEYAHNFLKERKISDFDITLISQEKAIGIGDVREFQAKIFLKPSRGKDKGIIIDTANGITIEAQNALLKVLEEPPQNTFILVSTSSKELLLPTIVSRCNIIDVSIIELTNIEEFSNIFTTLKKKGIGERLKIAQEQSKEKDQAVVFIQGLILAAREDLKKNLDNSKENFLILKKLQKGYSIVKNTNANLRLALENILLSI